jgi:dTDP-4-amino-4,6-dideoxygalactose transaminase
MDPIPLFDLQQQHELLSPVLMEQVQAVFRSGRFINGPFVREFEEQFRLFLSGGAPNTPLQVISCNSGTDALYLALRALDIGPGDEVITSVFSFFASAEVIGLTGARPVFVDINADTYNLDPQQLAERITPRTRAIMPVHLFGRPVNMTEVMEVAQRYQLAVVEDCAQAVGACWGGQQVGTHGHFGCFSFYPTKNLGACGDGGVVITQDPALAQRVRSLKDHGQTQQYVHTSIGVNSRMDALQAAVLQVKLPYLREWTWRRRGLAASYQRLLRDLPGLNLPSDPVGGSSVWNQFTVQLTSEMSPDAHDRDQVQAALQERGIGTRVYYPIPLHLQGAFRSLGHHEGEFPVAERCARRVFSLPLFPEMTSQQQLQVATVLAQVLTPSAVPQEI